MIHVIPVRIIISWSYNLSGYDAFLFLKGLRKKFNKNDVRVITENKEKYISLNAKIYVNFYC